MQPWDNSGDSPARFLAELRSLRDQSALSHAELSARAHYPIDVLQMAEVGPSLPDLPILSAYVRACGGEVTDWEDRWRTLSGVSAVPLSSGLPSRPGGGSAAASAGARAGASAPPVDERDSAFIMAVLARVTKAPSASSAPSVFTPASSGSSPTGPEPPGSDVPMTAPITEPTAGAGLTGAGPIAEPAQSAWVTAEPADSPAWAAAPPVPPPAARIPAGAGPAASARVNDYQPPRPSPHRSSRSSVSGPTGAMSAIPAKARLPLLVGVVIVLLIILIIALA